MPFDSQPRWTGRIMRKRWREIYAVLSLFALTACTAYIPPPLTTAHPAHLDATAAPESSPSTTLAYGPSDIPSPQPAYAMAQSATPASASDSNAVVGEGKVIAIVPSRHQIVVDHQAIKGFMDAMTMGFRVDPPSLLDGVKAGEDIRFTIDPQKNVIVKIEKMNP